MEARITRRDFLGSALLASGSMLLAGATPRQLLAGNDEFTGYGGIGDYSSSNGNTWNVFSPVSTMSLGRASYRRELRLRRHWRRNQWARSCSFLPEERRSGREMLDSGKSSHLRW